MTPCTRKTWLGKPACKFEARYDVRLPDNFKVREFEGSASAHCAVIESFKSRLYVRDCCIACGKTIDREKQG